MSKISGVVKYAFHRESCGKLDLAKTFMVQFCCGFCDCSAAGIPNMPGCSAKFGALGGGGSSGPLRLSRNGTLITPAYEGPADSVDETAATSSTDTTTGQPGPARLAAREDKKGVCAGDWTPGPEPHDDSYIRPADGPTIVASEVDGGPEGSEIQITRSRTQSWSTTMEMSLGIADVLSLGLSFSSTFQESITDSKAYSFTVPKGEKGYVIFTAYLRCSVGKRALPMRLNDSYPNNAQVLVPAMAKRLKAKSVRRTEQPMVSWQGKPLLLSKARHVCRYMVLDS